MLTISANPGFAKNSLPNSWRLCYIRRDGGVLRLSCFQTRLRQLVRNDSYLGNFGSPSSLFRPFS
ncbi:MAG: hypothetical protein ACKOBW_11035, partial [Planctomycetota bacterium]